MPFRQVRYRVQIKSMHRSRFATIWRVASPCGRSYAHAISIKPRLPRRLGAGLFSRPRPEERFWRGRILLDIPKIRIRRFGRMSKSSRFCVSHVRLRLLAVSDLS
jgi:hypothetical protein